MEQGTFHFIITCPCGITSCNDYNIQTTIEYALMQSIAFSDQSGNAMSYHTVSYFFTHADPNPVLFKAIFLYDHYKILVGIRSAILVDELELVILF